MHRSTIYLMGILVKKLRNWMVHYLITNRKKYKVIIHITSNISIIKKLSTTTAVYI